MRSIRVLIADDDARIRKCLGTLLCAEDGIDVVGEAADGVEAAAKAHELDPDVVVMDVEMPRMGGIEATCSIKKRQPWTRVVMFSVYDTARQEARQAGADCFLLKDCGRSKLAEAIRLTCGEGAVQSSVPAAGRGAVTDASHAHIGHTR